MQDDYYKARGLHGGVAMKVAAEMMATSREILPELIEMTRRVAPDYVIYDGMCPWGYFVAQIVGLPSVVSLALMPPIQPPPLAMLNMMRVFLPTIVRGLGKALQANRISQEIGEKYSVKPLSFPTFLNVPGDLVLSYTSQEFQVFADTVPDNVKFVGWTLRQSPPGETFLFEQMQGRRLIYVSLGTLNNDNLAFFKMCIEAFAGDDEYVVMTTGERISPEMFGALPDNISVHTWVPQQDILQEAALFISHGGLNSVHDSMYCGVPMLLVPQQAEQLLNGRRVVQLEAGLMLQQPQVTVQALRDRAAQLLGDSRFKAAAQRIGESFRAAGGAAKAADEVEAFLA